MTVHPILSSNSGRSVLGSVTPRLWTPPLRDLSEPGASLGPEWIGFADRVLANPLDPWQRWLALHAGELLPDGRPRFRIVLVLVARQNGKTFVPSVLAGYWSLVERLPIILGTSTKLDYAKESFMRAVALLEQAPGARGYVPAKRRQWVRLANGETQWDLSGARYKIAPADAEGGRSLPIDALIMDELRQHHDRSAWAAAVPAMNARPFAQAWALSNAGDADSVVLNAERAAALRFLQTGNGDPRVGLFEWSAPDGADPDDLEALAAANPNMGLRIHPDDLVGQARTAMATDDDPEALPTFLTEVHCRYVPALHSAIDASRWAGAGADVPPDLSAFRSTLSLGVDIAPDQLHAAAVAAALDPSGRIVLEVVQAWSGPGCGDQLVAALPDLVAQIRPRALGWIPGGPAASVASKLADRNRRGRGRRPWPPAGVTVEEIRAEATAVCMGLAELVNADRVVHSRDPLLDAHVASAQKQWQGAVWRFERKRDGGHVTAVYAAAVAAHLSVTLPPPIGKPRVVTSR